MHAVRPRITPHCALTALALLVGCAMSDVPPEVPNTATSVAHPEAATTSSIVEEAAPPPSPIHLAGGIVVDRARGEVVVPAMVATNEGWLEQIACLTGTREHESLLVVEASPSSIHAALLLLGLEPGAPGRWRYDEEGVRTIPPHGPSIEPRVRWVEAGVQRDEALVAWVRGVDGRPFPAEWVFAGSVEAENPPSWGPGRHYVADHTGSLVGLVTFGDETIAARTVIPDLVDVEAENWQAWSERIPPSGQAVQLVLRRCDSQRSDATVR